MRLFSADSMRVIVLGLLSANGVAAFPHHGSAEYKTDKPVVLTRATVTKFLWGNPHTLVLFDVKDDQGNVSHWAGEAGSPAAIRALGWNKNSLREGDVIDVRLYPAKFENCAGRLDSIRLPDGTTLKNIQRSDQGTLSRY